jgi:predicted XRE-type DNA-binding protein
VLEIVEDYDGDTYRAIYTVKFANAVYALHCFQKKSTKGIETAQHDIELIKSRLKAVQAHAGTQEMIDIEESSGNVYSDLGRDDAKQMLVKAQLAGKIGGIIKARHLTQTQAAEILGMSQPKVSAMLRGKFRGISETKMLDCLSRLGRDVQIVVKAAPRSRREGRIEVIFA